MKTAVLFGSSGLIGSNLLDNLINNNTYNKIKIFVRKSPSIDNSKVEVITNCGHMIIFERAFEMRKSVLEFLKK